MQKEGRRTELLEQCFECFCEHGLAGTSTKLLAAHCGMSAGNLFNYFSSKDEIIIESTAHCMEKVEDDFMQHAPRSLEEVERFLTEMPELTAKLHGAQYRFMYQVYTSPQYREHGKTFFKGVTQRYTEYAKQLEEKLGIDSALLQPLILMFVRACVHYALFEEEDYLRPQMQFLMKAVKYLTGTEDAFQEGPAGRHALSSGG